MNKDVLKLEGITKLYDNGILANNNINLTVYAHEIHAIVGENGAGKSTLMKMIFGMEQPTKGTISVNGTVMNMSSVDHAIKSGIGMVHQHFMLVESMDIIDNVMLGIEPKRGIFMDKAEARKRVELIAEKYMFKLDFNKPVSQIAIGMKQKVEIIKALIRGAKILILDEPTAVLTPQETDELFVQLKMLAESGHTILFISHKLNEVKTLSDRITVIRKGETKGTYDTDKIELAEITNLMVGRNVSLNYDKKEVETGDVLLSVTGLSTEAASGIALSNLNFEVRQGEIIGIAGVEGNGQSELIQILTGKKTAYKGSIEMLQSDRKNKTMHVLRKRGLGYIPEDRMHEGIAADNAIYENAVSTRYDEPRFGKSWSMDAQAVEAFSQDLIKQYQIVCHGSDHIVGYLSGGNIQKIVVGRECEADIQLLIAEQPTRGVDLGAAEIIHKQLLKMREEGKAILLISADLNEVVELSDRCLVFYDGEIVAHLKNPKHYTEQELGEYMLGLKKQEGQG